MKATSIFAKTKIFVSRILAMLICFIVITKPFAVIHIKIEYFDMSAEFYVSFNDTNYNTGPLK